MNTGQVLAVSRAVKKFGSTLALNGVDLCLKKGERLALLGPNGAGKTTLVRAIAGRLRLDQGQIEVSKSKGLGIVPQEIALYPSLTALENMEVFGKMAGAHGAQTRKRVFELLERVGLKDRAKHRVGTFSGGMKRRLNLACSLIHKPSIVLLDEPTVGVDPQSRQRIWELMDDLTSDGTSLIVTTHMLDEAEKVCDRIVILDQGKVIAQGTLDELIEKTVGQGKRILIALETQNGNEWFNTAMGFAENLALLNQRLNGFELVPQSGDLAALNLDNLIRDLPALLSQLNDLGADVSDVQIHSPSLHAVFIHLTGKELRDD